MEITSSKLLKGDDPAQSQQSQSDKVFRRIFSRLRLRTHAAAFPELRKRLKLAWAELALPPLHPHPRVVGGGGGAGLL